MPVLNSPLYDCIPAVSLQCMHTCIYCTGTCHGRVIGFELQLKTKQSSMDENKAEQYGWSLSMVASGNAVCLVAPYLPTLMNAM